MGDDGGYDATADALYGLPREEFTAARTAAVKAARAAGDRDLATRLQSLRRPTVVAWLANQLVREDPDEVTELVALGGRLREATGALDRDALKTLGSDQQRLVRSLVQRALAVAAAAGSRLGDDARRGLDETLHAALADPDAAAQLLAGRLVDGLQHSGFPLVTAERSQAPEASRPAERSRAAERSPAAEAVPAAAGAERRAAEAALTQARSEEASAAAARAAAAAADGAARGALDDARAQLARLREEVRAATGLLAAAERDAATTSAALERAGRDAAGAARRREAAERRLAELTETG